MYAQFKIRREKRVSQKKGQADYMDNVCSYLPLFLPFLCFISQSKLSIYLSKYVSVQILNHSTCPSNDHLSFPITFPLYSYIEMDGLMD